MSDQPIKPSTTTVDPAVEHVFIAWDDALGAKDLDAVMALYHPDATLESPLVCHLLGVEEGVVRGRDALRSFVAKVFEHQPAERRRFRTGFLTDGQHLTWVATAAGADGVIVQGIEAGGHRGGFDDRAPGDVGLLALLQLVRARIGDAVPLVATGGIATGHGVAAALAAGATAAQLGTAFMLCPEAATPRAHRDALANGQATTALTRAFTGRTARGIANRFLREHSADAPSAYPEVHHLTAPVRAAARQRGDADGFHLWAGQAYNLSKPIPAGELVVQLAEQAQAALSAATRRLESPG